MIAFEVKDMNCGHCVGTITDAVKSVDAQAGIAVHLPQRLVTIESSRASAEALGNAITGAGYEPTLPGTEPPPARRSKGACCCSG
ncbi:MAG: heavy-metal-associated domain-containing protein [Gammaproteobacteria bacterium]|nr:heavy-metal-associated domain-containing protein [Gammaproteobacteria bacterium]